ncbi:hypothetical protein C0993_004178, partial [Termitomyces sp. T159_Od127]
MDIDGAERLIDGGIYITVFLSGELGKSHWGLYHHYKVDSVKSAFGEKYVPRGCKYHIKNAGSSDRFIPDHAQTSGVLSSIFLVGLVLIGIVPVQYQTSLDSEIRSSDDSVSTTPDINCQRWVLDTVMRLVSKGFLRNRYTRNEIENEIWQFATRHWDGAWDAQKPRPIEQSRLFGFD